MPDLKTGRETPPDPDEWAGIWAALAKAERAWIVVGPLHAVVSNTKKLLAVIALIVWLSRDDIRAAIAVLAGGGQ